MNDRQGRERRIPLHMRIDVLGGVLVCLLAAIVWLGAASLAVGELRYFGPGFLPRICAAALLVGGLALLVRGVTQPDSAAERLVLAARGPLLVGLGVLLFALTIRGFAIGPLPIPRLGLLVAGPLTVLLAGLGSVEAEPRELIALGLGLSGLATLVFVDLLSVPLPTLPAIVESTMPSGWGFDWPRRAAAIVWLAAACGLWWLLRLAPADRKDRRQGDGE